MSVNEQAAGLVQLTGLLSGFSFAHDFCFDIHGLMAAKVSTRLRRYILSHAGRCYLGKARGHVPPLIFALALTLLPAMAQDSGQTKYVSPWRTPWTYKQASHWSELDPEYASCNTGLRQSPIDIQNTEKADLPVLQFDSRRGPLEYVINNRYTIRVDYHSGNGNFLLAEGTRYELTQFHFHHPSEEYIDGKRYNMEVHLMYKAGDGKVAGVTVFVKPGNTNPTIQKLWEHMPRTEGEEKVAGVEINPGRLLPRDTRSYYTYLGSITAPPCTEGVTWLVMKRPIEMSLEQIEEFAKLYPNDARPLQSLNGRLVKESR